MWSSTRHCYVSDACRTCNWNLLTPVLCSKMGEVAGSRGLLTSGVNLASMQPWLAGVDLRRPPGSNAPCNDPDLPGGPFVCYPEQHQQFGCLPVDPFELMFVKMGGAPVREGHFTPGLVQCARALDDGAECEYERRLR